ncbi:dynein axonemal intermediate chain 3 [Brachionichthys hirsutus]|uniref:dynein axonemal intermediate chain 3 n=1 Tax=Brachionichthys hirsutus TaxID=412623 RepID=UPI003604B8B2
MTSTGHPDDVIPLIVTSCTQELFGCLADDHVTEENPYKLLKKDDILQDIKTRAAVSDFTPVKKIVLDYPEEELLLVYDRDYTYGNNFYLVLTPEAKSRLLNPPQPEQPEENEVKESCQPKPWISLGSEQEIDNESVKETRPKLRYKFSRVLRKFGEPVCLSDHNPARAKNSYVECAPYQDSRSSIKQMERDCGTQAVLRVQSSTQTQRIFKRNIFTQYVPRELSDEDKENVLQSESLKDFCNSVTPRVLQALQQEELNNVFSDDCADLRTEAEDSEWSAKTSVGLTLYQILRDQKDTKDKKISCINWHPTIYGVLAVALTEKKDEQSDQSTTSPGRPSLIRFHCLSDPCDPCSDAQLLLESPDDISAFEFCPSDPNLIAGGCVNGQVVLWDISAHVTHLQEQQPGSEKASVNTGTLDDQKKTPVVRCCALSALESRHNAPISDIHWLPPTFEVSRTGLAVENRLNISVQVVSCSSDGFLMFWDVRVPKQSSQSAADRKPQSTAHGAPNTFKHLDRTWKPLFGVSFRRMDSGGEYTPLKFSLVHDTCGGDNTGPATVESPVGNGSKTELIPDYSRLRAPSANTLQTLEDVNIKLCMGTENGEIVFTDWKMEKDDSGQLRSTKPLHSFNIHQLCVNAVQRSPFFQNIILTIGGYNFAIWREGMMYAPIVLSPRSEELYTAGCWSPTQPATIFTGREDGSIEAWNLEEKTSKPSYVHSQATEAKVTFIKPWPASPKQHFLAVGDDVGTVSILQIPKALYRFSGNEILSVGKYFEREENRLKTFFSREQEEAADPRKKTEPEKPAKSNEDNEEESMKEYRDHLMMEENILKAQP